MIAARDAVAEIRAARDRELVIATMTPLGYWPDAGPHDFRLLGLMGGAAPIGLGLALARPDERVWVLDGDGSLLMALGVLSSVAGAAPANLVHVVFDNRVYAVSGAQPTPASDTLDWVALALGAGYRAAVRVEDRGALRAALHDRGPGPRMVVIACPPERPEDFIRGQFQTDATGEGARVRAALAG